MHKGFFDCDKYCRSYTITCVILSSRNFKLQALGFSSFVVLRPRITKVRELLQLNWAFFPTVLMAEANTELAPGTKRSWWLRINSGQLRTRYKHPVLFSSSQASSMRYTKRFQYAPHDVMKSSLPSPAVNIIWMDTRKITPYCTWLSYQARRVMSSSHRLPCCSQNKVWYTTLCSPFGSTNYCRR